MVKWYGHVLGMNEVGVVRFRIVHGILRHFITVDGLSSSSRSSAGPWMTLVYRAMKQILVWILLCKVVPVTYVPVVDECNVMWLRTNPFFLIFFVSEHFGLPPPSPTAGEGVG